MPTNNYYSGNQIIKRKMHTYYFCIFLSLVKLKNAEKISELIIRARILKHSKALKKMRLKTIKNDFKIKDLKTKKCFKKCRTKEDFHLKILNQDLRVVSNTSYFHNSRFYLQSKISTIKCTSKFFTD